MTNDYAGRAEINSTARVWYSMAEIQYTIEQCLWLADNYHTLAAGSWPPKPHSVENREASIPREKGHPAGYFTKPLDILSELTWRLDRCNDRVQDGHVFFCLRCLGWEHDHLARLLKLQPWELDRIEGKVLAYISGRRKKRGYFELFNHPRRARIS